MKFLKNFFKGKTVEPDFKSSVVVYDVDDRNIDKKFVEHSVSLDIPIVVGSQMAYNKYKEIDNNVDILRLGEKFTLEFRDREFPNGVLVDHTVTFKSRQWLAENNINVVGGFKEIVNE